MRLSIIALCNIAACEPQPRAACDGEHARQLYDFFPHSQSFSIVAAHELDSLERRAASTLRSLIIMADVVSTRLTRLPRLVPARVSPGACRAGFAVRQRDGAGGRRYQRGRLCRIVGTPCSSPSVVVQEHLSFCFVVRFCALTMRCSEPGMVTAVCICCAQCAGSLSLIR
jgi:hypothetical protein